MGRDENMEHGSNTLEDDHTMSSAIHQNENNITNENESKN